MTRQDEEALPEAAATGNVETVARLLKAITRDGGDVDHETNYETTALIWASKNGHESVVKLLLAAGAKIDHETNYGNTALIWASSNGHESVVKLLLAAGAKIDHANNYGNTALIWASFNGHESVVKTLLAAGAKTHHSNKNGETALIWASFNGHESVVKMLLAAGAKIDHADNNGETALIRAARSSHFDVVRSLLEAGADATIQNKSNETAIDYASDVRIVDLLRNSDNSAAALFAAISTNNLASFKRSVSKHKNARDGNERSPLHVAARLGRVEMVQLLLDRGANGNSRDSDDWTPLHYACQMDHVPIVKLLIAGGVRLDASDLKGGTPAMIAADSGHAEIVCLLHSHGASRTKPDSEGRSLIHHAAGCATGVAVVEHVLATSKIKAEEVDARDHKQATPLHYAVRAGNALAVTLLLSGGADINAQNHDGETALIIACSRGSTDIVQALLSNGARADLVSTAGETAMSAATSEEIRTAVQLYHNSQQYHERCTALMSSTDAKPTDADLEDLVPLITSAYDLRLFVSLVSLAFDGEPTDNCTARSLLLSAALTHVANSQLVYDDDACVFFKLVLDHCKTNAWLSPRDLILLDRQAEKVNNENVGWVLELQKTVHDHSWRLDCHEQSLRRVVDSIKQVHALVQENREAIKFVYGRVDHIQHQVDTAKKLLSQVVVHGNRLSENVQRLQKRVQQSEANVRAVASGLQNFRHSYVARVEQEERNKKMKMWGGLLATAVGFLFAPVLKHAFDAVIDMSNPIEIFHVAYGEKDIVAFLSKAASDNLLVPLVQAQFEKLMIPRDEFETLLREEIVLQHPELLDECVRCGLAIDAVAFGGSAKAKYAESLKPSLESEASVISALLSELQAALDEPKADPTVLQEPRSPPDTTQAINWSLTTPRKSVDNQPREQPKEEPKKTSHGSNHKTSSVPLVEKPVVSSQRSDTVDTTTADATVAFVGDANAFPFHNAVHESHGDADAFSELVDILAGNNDDPAAVMEMQLSSVSSSEESICAAEYAYSLGYRDVGDLLVARMCAEGNEAEAADIAIRTPAISVELLEADDDFAYIAIVDACGGDADECDDMCDTIAGDGHAIDARIRAKVVRESSVVVRWTAVEYAAHLGYVEIVRLLLKQWSPNVSAKDKIRLLKRAKERAVEVVA